MTGVVCTDPDMKYTMHRAHKVWDSQGNARCQLQHLNNEDATMGGTGVGGSVACCRHDSIFLPAVANVQGEWMEYWEF